MTPYVVITILVILFTLMAIYFPFPIVEIVGDSMHPTYKNGEYVLSTRLFSKKKIKKGDVYVFKAPYEMGEVKYIIKRVYSVKLDTKGNVREIYFLGDNPSNSYDSRNYGYVKVANVVGKIIKPRKDVHLV